MSMFFKHLIPASGYCSKFPHSTAHSMHLLLWLERWLSSTKSPSCPAAARGKRRRLPAVVLVELNPLLGSYSYKITRGEVSRGYPFAGRPSDLVAIATRSLVVRLVAVIPLLDVRVIL